MRELTLLKKRISGTCDKTRNVVWSRQNIKESRDFHDAADCRTGCGGSA